MSVISSPVSLTSTSAHFQRHEKRQRNGTRQMSTSQEKKLPAQQHSPTHQLAAQKNKRHSLCSSELPSSTIRFDDFFSVDRMVLEHPSARFSMRRICSEGPSPPMMPLPQTDGASDRRKLKKSKKHKKKAKNKSKDDNDDCHSERSGSTVNNELPADTENANGAQARDSAAEVADLSGAFEKKLTTVSSELTDTVASNVPKTDTELTPAWPVSLPAATPSAATCPVSIEVLGPSGNNTSLSSSAAELHRQTSFADSSNAQKQSTIDPPSGPVRSTSSQTEERRDCDDDKNGNISTQLVTFMNHSGRLYNLKCCSSCCCLHHLGDCCFCVFVPEGEGYDASKSGKNNAQGQDTETKGNDAMANNGTLKHPQCSQTVEEHRPSNASDGNKTLEGDHSPKMHPKFVPGTTMDGKLSPREANKFWDEMVAEEEEWGMASGDHLDEPKKPIEPGEIVAKNGNLGFIKRAQETGSNKTTEPGDILTPDGDTDEEETIKPANSVALDEAVPSGETTYPETRNEVGEAIKSAQSVTAEDKFTAGETVELNGATGLEITSEDKSDSQEVDSNGNGENTGEREISSSENHVDSNGIVASKSASAPLTKVDEIGKAQTTTGQTNAGRCSPEKVPFSFPQHSCVVPVLGTSTKLIKKPSKQDTVDVVASLGSTIEEKHEELLTAMTSLAGHLLELLGKNEFSDLSIVLRSSNEQFLPVTFKAHKILIARSPFIAALLKTPVDQIVAVSGDRFSMLQAFDLALRTMYGIPVLTGDQLKPVTLSALGYDDGTQPESFIVSTAMMDFTLCYSASGAFFQQPRVVESGIKLAVRLIDPDTIPLALWFGLDAAKFSVVFDDTAHPQPSTSGSQSTGTPPEHQPEQHPTVKELQERWSPFLVTACLEYIANKVSPDFRLFENAQLEELPDRVPEHLRSVPGTIVKSSRVKDVGFGSMPSIKEQKPSREVELVSAALICLPYKALQELFPLLDAKGVLSAGLAGRIVAAREDRRIQALRILSQQGPGVDQDDIPSDIRELGYREFFTTRLISVAGELDTVTERVTLGRTWKGLCIADQASTPTENGSSPTLPPALLS
ncbi:hypothetical protein BDW42DRAFT_200874 [Aspergillus taichungensis]|uniref:BTB domain-containing protein n=1 Tax=Aspergillus taichungensis TaxID=482145 RepID=A0A2J5HVH9_9EURO|nr:hypothetical protein BDW42DRAFT_200874 [Aspergillus taichungensis]